jgi:hypothetical protein
VGGEDSVHDARAFVIIFLLGYMYTNTITIMKESNLFSDLEQASA